MTINLFSSWKHHRFSHTRRHKQHSMGNCICNTLWRFISSCQEGLFLNNYWVRSSSSDWLLIFTNVCKIYVARIVICDSFHDISQSIFGSSKSYCSGEFSFQIVISLVSPNCHRNAQDFLLHILFVIVCFRLGFCLFVDDQEFSDQSLWTDHVSRSARHTTIDCILCYRPLAL